LTDLDSTLMDGLDPNESFDAAKLAALCQKWPWIFHTEKCSGHGLIRL
jgi:hypothetical protein